MTGNNGAWCENMADGVAAFDLTTLSEEINQLFPAYEFDLTGLLQLIMSGQLFQAGELVWDQIKMNILGEIGSVKQLLIAILVLGILSALLSNFMEFFSGKQVAQVGFYILYLLLIAVLTKAFLTSTEIAKETIENIVTFIRLFIPTYFMAVGASVGVTTAAIYYELSLMLALIVESFLVAALLPVIDSYVILSLLSGILAEERLTLLLDLIKKGISLLIKIAIGTVTGLSLLQSMITPVIDNLRIATVKNTISIIPGIGSLAEGVTEMVIGSALLVKNSLGVVGLCVLLCICALPLCKLFLIAGAIKLGAAIAGIVSDKRITGCANRVGDGSLLLFQTVLGAVAVFMVVIAIAAYTTL